MKLNSPMIFLVVYCGQQADVTSGAQTPTRGGENNVPLESIPPPAAENMIDNIREESDNDSETRHPNPSTVQLTKTGFQKFEMKL